MNSKQVTSQRLKPEPLVGRQLTLVFEGDVGPLNPAKAAALARRITPAWRDLAACSASQDPDAWFPITLADLGRADEAMRTCRACPVRRECLAAALLRREAGIWGGTSERARDQALGALCRGATVDAVLDLALADAYGLASVGVAA